MLDSTMDHSNLCLCRNIYATDDTVPTKWAVVAVVFSVVAEKDIESIIYSTGDCKLKPIHSCLLVCGWYKLGMLQVVFEVGGAVMDNSGLFLESIMLKFYVSVFEWNTFVILLA